MGEVSNPPVSAAVEGVVEGACEVLGGVGSVKSASGVFVVVRGVRLMDFLVVVWASGVVEVSAFISVGVSCVALCLR